MASRKKSNEKIMQFTWTDPAVKDMPCFEKQVDEVCGKLAAMLKQKNRSYGNSALDPVRIFSKATPVEQILVRLDDKLSRLKRGDNRFQEDTINDLLGYLVLLVIALQNEN